MFGMRSDRWASGAGLCTFGGGRRAHLFYRSVPGVRVTAWRARGRAARWTARRSVAGGAHVV